MIPIPRQRACDRLGAWSHAACAWADSQDMRVARFGDNMRSVAVTEGDKVEAQMRLGYQVSGYGIGAKEVRPKRLNFWGNAPETNAVGTHEFLDLCELLDCEPYFGGNVGSGTVQEMRDWVEYLTSNYDSTLSDERRANGREDAWAIPFWGIGNENWGCGGHMPLSNTLTSIASIIPLSVIMVMRP